jgi:hypothetical protein
MWPSVSLFTSKGRSTMNKRPRILVNSIVLGGLVVVFVPFLITLFFFQAYRSIGAGLTLLLEGGLLFYAGIKQIQAAKVRGESILWWKHYLIITAFMVGCFGILECLAGLYLTTKLVHDALESGIGTLLGIFFILFTLGIGIYGIVLALQQIENTRSRQPQ